MSDYNWANSPKPEAAVIGLDVWGRPVADSLLLNKPNAELISHGEYVDKLGEILDNYQIIEDPASEDRGEPTTFGITIANADAAKNGIVVQVSTSGSSLEDNPSNAVELADNALLHPDKAFVYIESLGNGNTSALTKEEQQQAKRNGLLVVPPDSRERVDIYEAFPTIQAMARALGTLDGPITHISADDTGAHIAAALMAALPPDSVERALLYNSTNMRQLSALHHALGKLGAMTIGNWRYARTTEDPLAVNKDRRQEAIKVLGDQFGSKATQLRSVRSGTFNPGKMQGEAQIFRHGRAATIHAAAALATQANVKLTYGLASGSVNYPGTEGVDDFLLQIADASAQMRDDYAKVLAVEVPLGHYGHSYHPLARLAIQDYALDR